MANELSDADREQVLAELFAGRKVSAVRLYREATGEGLKESKDAVEAIEAELRATLPDRFATPPRATSGCLPAALLLLSAAAASAAAAWLRA
jgi:hypothetical protein